MAIIRSFRELDVYALGREQAKRIFVISKGFPKEEKFSLTDQIRRSSRAVNAMIAERGLDEDTELHLSTKSTRR